MSEETFDYRFEKEQLGFRAADHLRKKGWTHTSATPGCFWLWMRTIPPGAGTRAVPEGTVILADQEMALALQLRIDDMLDVGEADDEPKVGTVERLDLSKPPPGYTHPEARSFEDGAFCVVTAPDGVGFRGDEAVDVLAAAWAHHQALHDPPGMEVFSDDGSGSCWHYSLNNTNALNEQSHGSREAARAATWRWYLRRLVLADRLERGFMVATERREVPLQVWPRALTWSDDQCEQVEKWVLNPTSGSPEVLHG